VEEFLGFELQELGGAGGVVYGTKTVVRFRVAKMDSMVRARASRAGSSVEEVGELALLSAEEVFLYGATCSEFTPALGWKKKTTFSGRQEGG
jgi:hypothetical protein